MLVKGRLRSKLWVQNGGLIYRCQHCQFAKEYPNLSDVSVVEARVKNEIDRKIYTGECKDKRVST